MKPTLAELRAEHERLKQDHAALVKEMDIKIRELRAALEERERALGEVAWLKDRWPASPIVETESPETLLPDSASEGHLNWAWRVFFAITIGAILAAAVWWAWRYDFRSKQNSWVTLPANTWTVQPTEPVIKDSPAVDVGVPILPEMPSILITAVTRERCWVRAQVDGQKPVEGFLYAGTENVMRAHKSVVVRDGCPKNITFSYNQGVILTVEPGHDLKKVEVLRFERTNP